MPITAGTQHAPFPYAFTAPSAPQNVTATPGNGQATVAFQAPITNGGTTITGYTVTSLPAGGVDTQAGTPALSHLITGLTNGQSYTFTVTATNAIGTSLPSIASNPVTPSSGVTVPAAPTIGTPTAGNSQVSVPFTPNSNGGSAITSFSVQAFIGGLASGSPVTGAASPIVVTGLTNGTAYTFEALATNAIGNSPYSSMSAAATPAVPTVPAAPTIGTAVPNNVQANVTFTANSTGGSPITGFTATAYISGVSTGITASGTASPLTVTGLTNGIAYTFTVHATNAIGNSAESAQSNSVTPVASGLPSAPLSPVAFSDGSGPNYTSSTGGWAWIVFGAPASDGGSQLTGYRATIASGPSGVGSTADSVLYPAFNGVSCRCDFQTLAPGTYTFTVQAKNANGLGAASSATASVTVGSVVSPYYAINGNGFVTIPGNSNVWSAYNGYSSGGNPNGWKVADTSGPIIGGHTSSASIPAGSYALIAWTDPVTDQAGGSGSLNVANYNYLTFQVNGSAYAATQIYLYIKFHAYVFGICDSKTTPGSRTLSDVNQQGSGPGWTSSSMNISPAGLNNLTTASPGFAPITNTSNTIGNSSGLATFSPGDYYYWSHSDIAGGGYPFPSVKIDSYITSNGGVWQNNAWNTVVIPMSAFHIAANLQPGCIPNQIQEFAIGNSTGVTQYFDNIGFTT